MLHALLMKIGSGLIALGILFGASVIQKAPELPYSVSSATPSFGSFSPTGGGPYRLGSSIGTTDTTVKLSSFKEPVSNTLYTMNYLNSDIGYGTISPQSSVSEFVSFTGITQNSDGSALLTGVTRGLTRTPAGQNCTASTTLQQAHAGQSIFILSNSPCFYAEYIPLRTTATSSAVLVFASTTIPRLDLEPSSASWNLATGTSFITLNKLNATAIAGASNASQAVNGVLQLATSAQAGSSTITGSTGANLGISTIISTSSPYTTGSWNVITMPNAKIKQAFLDLTELFAFTKATFTTSTSTSFALGGSALALNGVNYRVTSVAPTASTSVLATDASSNLSWYQPSQLLYASGAQIDVKSTIASTTLFATSIPAGTIGTNKAVRVRMMVSSIVMDTTVSLYVEVGYGGASTTIRFTQSSGSNAGFQGGAGYMNIDIVGSGTNTQNFNAHISGMNATVGGDNTQFVSKVVNTTFTQNDASAQPLTIIVRPSVSGNNNEFTMDSVIVDTAR